MIVQTFVAAGDRLVLSEPSYAMLGVYAKITRAAVESVPYGPGISLDVKHLEEILSTGPRLVALPNPDQPTGTVMAPAQLRQCIELAHRHGTVVAIDEAYHPFYRSTAFDLIRDYDNLLVTRSFSKAWGLSGLRLGMMAGQPALVEYASRLRGLHEVNAVAVAVGCYLLDHPESWKPTSPKWMPGVASSKLGLGLWVWVFRCATRIFSCCNCVPDRTANSSWKT